MRRFREIFLRVLVIEDDPALGHGLERFLRDAGFSVDRVSDGVQAVEALMAQNYDLLLEGARVIDPRNGIDGVMDVAITGRKIASVAPHIDTAQAKKTNAGATASGSTSLALPKVPTVSPRC